MSRMRLAVLLTFVYACTDQNDPTDPAIPNAPDEIALEDDATGIELELDYADSRREARTALSGGATTVFDESEEAFGSLGGSLRVARAQPQGENAERHELGDAAFELVHVDGPGRIGGLGPLFDNVACEFCHPGDGRGRPPADIEPFESMLFRASVEGRNGNGGPNEVPGFGGQLQMRSLPEYQPEIAAAISYVEDRGTFADGSPFQLRVATYSLSGVYRPLPPGVFFSPRTAPVVFGLGLLEAVAEWQILSLADPGDRNHDGISGRPWVASAGRRTCRA